jgi:hypothetical protein
MTFKEYFSDVSLGRLPAGVKMPYDLQYGVTAFASGDNMQLYFKVIKDVQKKVILVNVITREQQYFGSWTIIAGGSPKVFSSSLGKYEMNVYVDDMLVAILPFDVQ